MGFIRNVKYYCGDEYLETELLEMPNMNDRGKPLRRKKEKPSTPGKAKWNRKNAIRKFRQKVMTNFSKEDYYMTFTFSTENMPETKEDGKKEFHNFIRRINRRRKKLGLDAVKYMGTMESKEKKTGTTYHFHMIISGGLSRDEMEEIWKKGLCNASKLRIDDNELMQKLCQYITKKIDRKEKHSRSYLCSRNLKNPIIKKNDWKFSHRKLNELAGLTDCPEVWESIYIGYQFIEASAVFSDLNGWHVMAKLKRRDVKQKK